MMGDEEPKRIPTDPESDAHFDLMKLLIAEEILARIQVGDRDVDDPGWLDRVAAMSADRVLDVFHVRQRSADAPRYLRET